MRGRGGEGWRGVEGRKEEGSGREEEDEGEEGGGLKRGVLGP